MGRIYQHEAEIFYAGRYRRNGTRLLHGAGCALAPGRCRIFLRQLERTELEPAVRRDAGHGLRLRWQLRLRYAPGLRAACDAGHHLGVRLRLPQHDVPLPDTGEQDFTGKVLVLSPDILREDCWQPENQLWLAHSGFGCRPHACGRSVLCTCLGDGETTRWNRSEFVDVIRDECIPDWAAEKLAQLRQEQPERTQEMTM